MKKFSLAKTIRITQEFQRKKMSLSHPKIGTVKKPRLVVVNMVIQTRGEMFGCLPILETLMVARTGMYNIQMVVSLTYILSESSHSSKRWDGMSI
nr:hypothetical protein [Desulforamulus aeronauticus]